MDFALGFFPPFRLWGCRGLRHSLQQLVKEGFYILGLLFPPFSLAVAIGMFVVAGQTADFLHLIVYHPNHTMIKQQSAARAPIVYYLPYSRNLFHHRPL